MNESPNSAHTSLQLASQRQTQLARHGIIRGVRKNVGGQAQCPKPEKVGD